MGKHVLSKQDQIQGLRKAIQNRKTPPWLKPSMRRYLKKLERKVDRQGRRK